MTASTQSIATLETSKAKELFIDWRQYDGKRLTSSVVPSPVYVVMNGQLHGLPSPDTYNSIFSTWENIEVNDYLVNNIPYGENISVGAVIVRGGLTPESYLVTQGKKCQILPGVEKKYSFNSPTVVPQILVNSIPSGDSIS
jgi:hypothetical protein